MSTLKPTFALIARWRRGPTPVGQPDKLWWSDGTPASLDDYWEHQFDTQECIAGCKGGVELHIFPEIIADIRFQPSLGSWVIEGAGVHPAVLEEKDPNASDASLLLAICRLPTFYRARVHRQSPDLSTWLSKPGFWMRSTMTVPELQAYMLCEAGEERGS